MGFVVCEGLAGEVCYCNGNGYEFKGEKVKIIISNHDGVVTEREDLARIWGKTHGNEILQVRDFVFHVDAPGKGTVKVYLPYDNATVEEDKA